MVRNIKCDVVNGRLGAEILEALEDARNNPLNDAECRSDKQKETHVQRKDQSLLEMLRFLLKLLCYEQNIVTRLVATEDDLRDFIYDESTGIMQGWRYEIFGQFAEKLKNGELSISYNPTDRKIEVR